MLTKQEFKTRNKGSFT